MGVVMGGLGFLAGLVLCGCEGQGFLVALLEGSQLVGGEPVWKKCLTGLID